MSIHAGRTPASARKVHGHNNTHQSGNVQPPRGGLVWAPGFSSGPFLNRPGRSSEAHSNATSILCLNKQKSHFQGLFLATLDRVGVALWRFLTYLHAFSMCVAFVLTALTLQNFNQQLIRIRCRGPPSHPSGAPSRHQAPAVGLTHFKKDSTIYIHTYIHIVGRAHKVYVHGCSSWSACRI